MEAITTDTLTERMDSMQESDKVRAERVRTGQQYGAGQEGIDLFSMMDDALRCFQKYWLQFCIADRDRDCSFYYLWKQTVCSAVSGKSDLCGE